MRKLEALKVEGVQIQKKNGIFFFVNWKFYFFVIFSLLFFICTSNIIFRACGSSKWNINDKDLKKSSVIG